ncbi:MAG: FAD/NAD(P)-binding protein [Acidobacteriota bacterium]
MIDRKPDPMLPQPYRIERILKETGDTFTLELESTNGAGIAAFSAGQFNMLYVFGVGEVPISISGDPGKPGRMVHTIRAVGAVTKVMRTWKRGSVIGLRGPYGKGWPIEESRGNDIIIIGGGIGLAPLRPALYRLIFERQKYGRVILFYGTRTPADILFHRELESWRGRLDLDVYVTVDRAIASWRGNVGVVTTLIPKASFDPLQTTAFVCGPGVMMRFTALELERRGIPSENIYLSLERSMKCGIGLCGHCQLGPCFICKDGPVFCYNKVKSLIALREI